MTPYTDAIFLQPFKKKYCSILLFEYQLEDVHAMKGLS